MRNKKPYEESTYGGQYAAQSMMQRLPMGPILVLGVVVVQWMEMGLGCVGRVVHSGRLTLILRNARGQQRFHSPLYF